MAAVEVIEEQLYEDFMVLPTRREWMVIAAVGLVTLPFEIARVPLRAVREFLGR